MDCYNISELLSSKGKLFCFSNLQKRQRTSILKECINSKVFYVVGKSKRHFLKRKTVYEELLDVLKIKESVLKYAAERELSESRLYRPLESLSSEKWRASIAIGLLSGKKYFLIPWLPKEIFHMYGKKWLNALLVECRDKEITVVVFSDIEAGDSFCFNYFITNTWL